MHEVTSIKELRKEIWVIMYSEPSNDLRRGENARNERTYGFVDTEREAQLIIDYLTHPTRKVPDRQYSYFQTTKVKAVII